MKDQNSPWYKNYWRRMLVDAHIPDWDPRFLAKWEPKVWVDNLVRAKVSAAMVYTNSHVGLCYWPTKSGKMHDGLKGRDIVGEITADCQQRGIPTIAYHSLIFNNWAYINHPDWRIIPAGKKRWPARYGLVCPNDAEYRQFVIAQINEIFSAYPFSGVFYDMTFWPDLCVCPDCKERALKEIGMEPMTEPQWNNPDWLRFQRWREACILDFAKLVTDTTKQVNPKVTVTHQFSTVLYDWGNGVSFNLADYCDYLSGDFYGDPLQQTIACKAYFSIAKNHSFEFMTTGNVSLWDHVTLKPKARLESAAALALAHSTPFVFIDAINPDGTQNRETYELLGEVFGEIEKYEKFLGGELRADVGVYFSQDSKFSPGDEVGEELPHFQAVRGACQALQRAHIPYGIVTKRNLLELVGAGGQSPRLRQDGTVPQYQVIVLPDVLLMDDEEAEAFRQFVKAGGGLYASCRSGARHQSGKPLEDFLLADVFGVSYKGNAQGIMGFLKPTDEALKQVLAPQKYLTHRGFALAVKPTTAEVLAERFLPWTDPGQGDVFGSFSSIHSNPPGLDVSEPALMRNSFGQGTAIYSTMPIEWQRQDGGSWAQEAKGLAHEVNGAVFVSLLRSMMKRPAWFEAETHPTVEVTYFDQPENNRILVSMVSCQTDYPNLPVDAKITVRLPEGRSAGRVDLLPEERPLGHYYDYEENSISFELEKVKLLAMVAITY